MVNTCCGAEGTYTRFIDDVEITVCLDCGQAYPDQIEKYEYDDFVNVVNKYNEESNIAEFEKWSNSYDQYKEAGNNAIMSTLLATKDEGIAGFSGVLVQSLAGLLSPESIGAAGTLGAAGAGVG